MNIFKHLRALLRPDPKIVTAKAGLDASYKRFMAEINVFTQFWRELLEEDAKTVKITHEDTRR